jgi:sucrose phosphorylase
MSQKIQNQIQLMTYPDSLGGNLKTLKQTLDTYLKGAVSFVHILPPYPSSADRGFCPLTHLEIDPKWGNWEDIQTLSKDYNLMLDVIAGHVSDKSVYFQDYLEKGEESEYYELFNRVEKVFSDGNIKIDEILNFDYLGPIPPLQIIYLKNGQKKLHFKTFMPFQIDLDITSKVTKDLIESFISNLAKKGIKMIRLDAVDTLRKNRKLGYDTVPEVFQEIQWLIKTAHKYNLEVLCEFFGNEEESKKIVDLKAYLYDFSLCENILYSLYTKDFSILKKHFELTYPKKDYLITHITNHDGIRVGHNSPVLTQEQIEFTTNKLFENGGKSTQLASGLNSNNIDVNRINTTLFEAFLRDQNLTFIAQALVLFAPGTPQLYYNDILMERNDEQLYQETGEGRSLLRHNFEMEEMPHKFKQPGTVKLIELMKERNNNPAFLGQMEIKLENNILEIKWQNQEFKAVLELDYQNMQLKTNFN